MTEADGGPVGPCNLPVEFLVNERDSVSLMTDGSPNDVSSTFSTQPIKCDGADSFQSNSLESKILKQIEFYFSDANILKDRFMLKSVKSNKEGWVKLATIAGFKRVQSLTKDIDVVRTALKNSSQVEISDDGTRVRRRYPLPEWDKSVYSRTILITRFGEEDVINVPSISEFFESVNLNVRLVRIIDAGSSIPPDLVKTALFIGYLGKEKCAVVEFDSRESAQKALEATRTVWPSSFCTILQRKPKEVSEKLKPKIALNIKDPIPKADLSARPQIYLTSCMYNDVKVELIREPRAPPNEDSVGFEPNWREALRMQRLSLEGHSDDPLHSLSNSVSSDEFLTPQAPSPRAQFSPNSPPIFLSPQPASQLMFLDEAIVSMIPTAGSGGGG